MARSAHRRWPESKPASQVAKNGCRLPVMVMSWVRFSRRLTGRPVRVAPSAATAASPCGWNSLPPKPPPIRRHCTVTWQAGRPSTCATMSCVSRRVLRARLDEDLAVLVDQRQRGLGLQVEVLLAADLQLAAEPVGRPLQRGGRVAAADRPLVALVAAGRDGVVHADQRGQRLVLGLDVRRPLARGLQRLAEHPADRVPVVHDLAREQRLVVLLAGVVEAGHVLRGQHPDHAGHVVRGLGAQPGDPRVRVRGLHRPGVQRALRPAGQVLGVQRGAGHVQAGALVRDREPHHGPIRPVGQRAILLAHDRASPCSSGPFCSGVSAKNFSSELRSIAIR